MSMVNFSPILADDLSIMGKHFTPFSANASECYYHFDNLSEGE